MKIFITAVALILLVLVPVADADEASKKVIVEDILQILKVDQMRKPLFDQMRSMMEQQFTQMGASEDMKPILKRYNDNLLNIIEETLDWHTLKDDIINIYSKTFTEVELKGMLAFYKSPVGQSVISKMPVVLQQSMLTMQKRMPMVQQKVMKLVEQLAEEIKEEVEKKKRGKGEDTKGT
jgi:uncharacterized protein